MLFTRLYTKISILGSWRCSLIVWHLVLSIQYCTILTVDASSAHIWSSLTTVTWLTRSPDPVVDVRGGGGAPPRGQQFGIDRSAAAPNSAPRRHTHAHTPARTLTSSTTPVASRLLFTSTLSVSSSSYLLYCHLPFLLLLCTQFVNNSRVFFQNLKNLNFDTRQFQNEKF